MPRNKAKRAPNAPKRNLSAYLLYQNAMRDQFRALNPGMTFGQLSKYTSAMYAEMPPVEKEGWVSRAESDKERYLLELSQYVPPPGYDEKGDVILTNPTIGTVPQRSRSSKTERDVNAPKRNMSAYLLYQNGMRNDFKRENPGMTFGQLAKYTSHMYKNLTVEEKDIWVKRALQDKLRYDQELALYTPPPGHDARGTLIEESRPKRRNKRVPKDPDAPKRASGAYVFFTNEMRPEVMKQFPGIKFVEMGRILGERWRALTHEEKVRFETMAAQDKVRFQLEMQQYTAAQAVQQQVFAQRQAQAAAAAAAAAAVGAQAAANSMVQQQQVQIVPSNNNAFSQHPQFLGAQVQQAPTNMPYTQNVYMDPQQHQHAYYHAGSDQNYDPSKFTI